MQPTELITNVLNSDLLTNGLSKLGQYFLRKPGDRLEAFVTKTNRQVIKGTNDVVKYSAVRYPSTGTVVETIVRKTP